MILGALAWLFDGACLAAALVFATMTARAVRGLRLLPDLAPAQPSCEGNPPRVAVVVPCRDGAARIGACVAQLLAQRHVDLALVVVDDGSTDASPSILARAAAADPRLQVVTVAGPPDGWLGKCHALQRGAEQALAAADRDWLLFVDADARLAPDTIAAAVQHAAAHGADHVTLLPALAHTGGLGRAWIAGMCLALLVEVGKVHGSRRGYLGMGGFNMLRAALYRRIGGHRDLRLELIDDIHLGRLVRAAGATTRVAMARDNVEVEWVTGLRSGLRLLEKNMFAAVRLRTTVAVAMVVAALGLWLVGLLAPCSLRPAGLAAGAGLWSTAWPAQRMARRYGWAAWPVAACSPIVTLPLQAAALWRSTALAVWRGGIHWRGRHVPLAALRAFATRRSADTR